MKNLKVNLSVFAMVLGLSFAFAFKAPAPSSVTNDYWVYNGTGNPTSPSSYTETSGDPCSGSTKLCEIFAPASGSRPVISNALATRIQNLDTSDGDVFLKN